MERVERLAGRNALAKADMEFETGRLRVRRTGELGDLGNSPVVDLAHCAWGVGDNRVAIRRDRGLAHAALRFANGLEFPPGAAVGENRGRKTGADASSRRAADLEE